MFRSVKLQFMLVLLMAALAACAPAPTGSLASSTARPTTAPTAAPTSTPIVAASVTPESATPTPGNSVRYQGPNPYRSSPAFSVDYDPSVWEFVEKDGSGREPKLNHRSIPQCSVWLKAGPMGAQPVSTAQIAGYEWTIFLVQPDIMMYSIPWDDISFIFGLILPEPYAPVVKSPCQQALEDVMQTFQVVPN